MPFKDPQKARENAAARYQRNRVRIIAQVSKRAAGLKPEKRAYDRSRALQKLYKITSEDWEALFVAQGKRCAICKTSDARWHTDHDHDTGTVRGILCGSCNMALGLLKDNPLSLASALTYLREHGK